MPALRWPSVMPNSDFSTLFELLPIGAYRSSPDGRQLRANPALVRMDGYETEAEMLAATKDLAREWYVDPHRREQFKALLNKHGRVVDFDSEVYRHKTRERIWVRVHAHVVRDAQGDILYYEGTVQDITEQRAATKALETSERRFRALTALSSDWYWEMDTDFRFSRLDINERNMRPSVNRDALGKTRRELGHSNLTDAEWDAHEAILKEHLPFHNFEFQCATRDGLMVWHSISGEPMFDNGVFSGYQGVGRDVTEQKLSEEAIRQLAFHDPLTGLPNRRLLMDRIAQALSASVRRHQVSVLMFLDLDRFKPLNDEWGHDCGDILLIQVAQRLKACVRANDTVARLGGDEFVVLLADAGDCAAAAASHAAMVGEKILQALRTSYDLGSCQHQGYTSIGAVVMDDPTRPGEAFLKQADAAMYRAKASGGNQLHFFKT